MQKHWSITVRGRVQGVSYRAYTQMKAEHLDLGGYVENRPDGTVHVEVEGPEESLEQFRQWLWEGSPTARVESVEVAETEPVPYRRFEIR
jgi:acylphosphatase